MQQRAGDRGQVGAVHQRQRGELDEHRDVVGVADEAVGPARHHAQRHRRHHPHVPVHAQRRDHPEAQRVRRPRPARPPGSPCSTTNGRVEQQRLDHRAGEDPRVQRDHRGEHRLGQRGGAAGGQLALVAARQAQLDEAATGDDADQQRERRGSSPAMSVPARAAASRRSGPGRTPPGYRARRPAAAAASAIRAGRTAPTRSTGCRSRAARPTTAAYRRA